MYMFTPLRNGARDCNAVDGGAVIAPYEDWSVMLVIMP